MGRSAVTAAAKGAGLAIAALLNAAASAAVILIARGMS